MYKKTSTPYFGSQVYYTWKPAVPPASPLNCTYETNGTLTATVDAIPVLYDVFKLHSATGQAWEFDCEGVATYLTLSHALCPYNNVETRGSHLRILWQSTPEKSSTSDLLRQTSSGQPCKYLLVLSMYDKFLFKMW